MDERLENWLEMVPVSLRSQLSGVTKANSTVITINGEPVGKGRPRFTRTGRCYTPKTTLLAEHSVRSAVVQQYQRPPLNGALAVELLAISPIPKSWSLKRQGDARRGEVRPDRKPDFDNLVKLYCDALNGILWEDDKQIVDGRCIKVYGERPGVLLWCWPV